MKKVFIATMSIILMIATRALPVTWYDHCYKHSCPKGYKMVKKQTNLMGSKSGTHECINTNGKATAVIKKINYDQCHTKPCNGLDTCIGYLDGVKDSKKECPKKQSGNPVSAVIHKVGDTVDTIL